MKKVGILFFMIFVITFLTGDVHACGLKKGKGFKKSSRVTQSSIQTAASPSPALPVVPAG